MQVQRRGPGSNGWPSMTRTAGETALSPWLTASCSWAPPSCAALSHHPAAALLDNEMHAIDGLEAAAAVATQTAGS